MSEISLGLSHTVLLKVWPYSVWTRIPRMGGHWRDRSTRPFPPSPSVQSMVASGTQRAVLEIRRPYTSRSSRRRKWRGDL